MDEQRDGSICSETSYNTRQVAERLNVSVYVIRRLCNSGLIPHVRRDHFRNRVLTAEQVEYAGILIKLEQAGMTRSELRQFAKLFWRGDGTLVEQKAMLETQKRQLWQELEARKRGIDILERQIELIDEKAR